MFCSHRGSVPNESSTLIRHWKEVEGEWGMGNGERGGREKEGWRYVDLNTPQHTKPQIGHQADNIPCTLESADCP